MEKRLTFLRTLIEIFRKGGRKPCASVVIPARDAEKTIERVVDAAKKSRFTREVLVVDGFSGDRTRERAEKAGAKVIQQSRKKYPGKGIALRDGLEAAENEFVVFVDADIDNLSPRKIDELVEPLVEGQADFVKANYAHKKGRVTELAAKPLLRLFFPEATAFGYPLSGEMAGRKTVLKSIEFEEDWGVDVGILLDLLKKNARITEVDLTYKQHPQKELEDLGAMAFQVSKAILRRAKAWGRWKSTKELRVMEDIEEGLEEALEDAADKKRPWRTGKPRKPGTRLKARNRPGMRSL